MSQMTRVTNKTGISGETSLNNSQVIDNNIVSNNNTATKSTKDIFCATVSQVSQMSQTAGYSETFSQLLDVGRLPQKFVHILT